MDELVERLRREGENEGADEIERLCAALDHAVRRLSDLEYHWMGTEDELWGPIIAARCRVSDFT